MTTAQPKDAQFNQERFDKEYITAAQIMRLLKISRAGFLYGRRAGKLPPPIVVNEGRLLVWRRVEIEEPLNIWKQAIDARTTQA